MPVFANETITPDSLRDYRAARMSSNMTPQEIPGRDLSMPPLFDTDKVLLQGSASRTYPSLREGLKSGVGRNVLCIITGLRDIDISAFRASIGFHSGENDCSGYIS